MANPTKAEVEALISANGFKAQANETHVHQLAAAVAIVDTNLAGAYPDETLDRIKLWLSAHLVSMSNHRQVKTKGGGGSAATAYTGTFSMGLNATTFGQTIKLLDPKGILIGLESQSLNSGHAYAL